MTTRENLKRSFRRLLPLIALLAVLIHFSQQTAPVAYLQTESSQSLAAPTLSATYSGTNSVELGWTEVSGADRYDLRVWRNSDTGWELISADRYVGRTYVDDTLSADRPQYYYIVAAVDAVGVTGQWSNQVRVVVSEVLPAPTLTLNETVVTTIELSWTEITGADRYEVWAWWDSDPGWQRIESYSQSTSYSYGNLVPGRTYYFAVRAIDTNGVEGAWSNSPSTTAPHADSRTLFDPISHTDYGSNADSNVYSLTFSNADPNRNANTGSCCKAFCTDTCCNPRIDDYGRAFLD